VTTDFRKVHGFAPFRAVNLARERFNAERIRSIG